MPSANEVEPEAKYAATRLLEAVGTTRAGSPGLRDRVARAGGWNNLAALVAAAGPLVPPSLTAATRVVYPQYGGLTDTTASVMAIVDQSWRRRDGRVARRTLTVDVRLEQSTAGWQVTDLLPAATPPPVARPGGDVRALLGRRRVDIPEVARAELSAGLVGPAVVNALLALSASYAISVCVFAAGHPTNVFGSTSVSNHTRGQAVDIWAVNGRPVVDLSLDDGGLLRRFLRDVGATGSNEIGGPVVPVGAGAAHFANALHRDHVHVGFDV